MPSVAARRQRTAVRIGPKGRIVIPQALREALGLREGDTLVAHAEDGRLVLETRAAIRARIRQRLAAVPKDQLLSEELIAERRAEARREAERE